MERIFSRSLAATIAVVLARNATTLPPWFSLEHDSLSQPGRNSLWVVKKRYHLYESFLFSLSLAPSWARPKVGSWNVYKYNIWSCSESFSILYICHFSRKKPASCLYITLNLADALLALGSVLEGRRHTGTCLCLLYRRQWECICFSPLPTPFNF